VTELIWAIENGCINLGQLKLKKWIRRKVWLGDKSLLKELCVI
jgi:hypothetical protein